MKLFMHSKTLNLVTEITEKLHNNSTIKEKYE